MRLFKRRCSDPSPQLVSLSPIANDEDQDDLDNNCLNNAYDNNSGQNTPAGKGSRTPISGSPKSHRKGTEIGSTLTYFDLIVIRA